MAAFVQSPNQLILTQLRESAICKAHVRIAANVSKRAFVTAISEKERPVSVFEKERLHALMTKRQKTQGQTSCDSKRASCNGLLLALVGGMFMGLNVSPVNAAIISSPECFNGAGPGCASNSTENKLIERLLEKSLANKSKVEQELQEKYWQEGYGSYFSFGFNKKLIRGDDGKWTLEEPDDFVASLVKRFRKTDSKSEGP